MSQEMPATSRELPSSVARVKAAAAALGLTIEPRLMPDSTRTAQEAAAACGCAVAQIVKSLLFCGAESGKSYLFLVSGANRVDEKAARRMLGEALKRPDADAVRATTGFAIGGVPPFGHATPSPVLIDTDLLGFDMVFAAAGHPNAIFPIDPKALASATGASIVNAWLREVDTNGFAALSHLSAQHAQLSAFPSPREAAVSVWVGSSSNPIPAGK